jgi:RHS repeat-associated protein
MYNPWSAGGAAMKSLHLARAVLAHPNAARWAGLGLLAVFAACVVAALVASFVARGRRGFARARRGFAPRLRLASASLAIVMAATACSGGGGIDRSRSPLLTGDTKNGPAVGTHYYHRNHINSSSVVTDAAGNEATRIVYLPFGEISQANSVGIDGVTAKFTAQEYDAETGLYYYNARYYDPALGRFASADAFVPDPANAQTHNRYSYVANNPIVYVDPTGHFLDDIGDFFDDLADAARGVVDAVVRAAEWVANAAVEAAKFVIRAHTFAWEMVKQTVRNPIAIATFIVSVALSVATLNPAPMIMWIQATAAAIAAQSMAMAAGVTNPTVLALIGAVAGAAAAGASLGELLKIGARAGVTQGLAKLQGDRLARWLGPLNALAASIVVNYAGDVIGNALADGNLSDPGQSDPKVQAGRSSSQLSEGTPVRAAGGMDTGEYEVVIVATRMTKWQAMSGWDKIKFATFSTLRLTGGLGLIVAGGTGGGLVGAGVAMLGLGPLGAGLLAAGAISFGILAIGITLGDVLATATTPVQRTSSPRRVRRRRRSALASGDGWVPCPA